MMQATMRVHEQRMRPQRGVSGKVDRLPLGTPDERICLTVWQVIPNQHREVIGDRHPANIERPVVSRAETNAVSRVIAPIKCLWKDMGSLDFRDS